MAGLARFIEILRLFDQNKRYWTIQELAEASSVPTSTVYRTVRELVEQGFLDPSIEAHYRLGAAFIEFDRRLRLTDPLIYEGTPILQDLLRSVSQPCVGVVSRLYRDQVICVVDETTDNADIPTSYERGRPMPLIRGATSKTILAQLSRARLGKIVKSGAGIDRTFEDIAAELSAIRKRGFAVTRGEVDTDLVGISVPVSRADAAINASISLIIKRGDADDGVERRLIMLLISAASMLVEKLRPS